MTYAHDAHCNTQHEAGPDACPPPRAAVGDVIEHGQPIPANVRVLRDRVGDLWEPDRGGWILTEYKGEQTSQEERDRSDPITNATLLTMWVPLTVVEVDPEPQPAAGMCATCGERRPANGSDVCWRCEQISALKTQPAERKLIGPPSAHWDAPCTDACYEPEPQPADDDEDPRDELIERLLRITGVDRSEHLAAAVQNLVTAFRTTPAERRDVDSEPQPVDVDMTPELQCGNEATHGGHRWEDDGEFWCDGFVGRAGAPRPAPSGPLVLTLPEVPAEAVALVTEDGTRFVPHGNQGGHSWWQSDRRGTFSLARILSELGPATVELAPPREPRTWPKLDALPVPPWEMDRVEVDGHGTWYRHQHRNEDWWHQGDNSERMSFPELCTLGEVREVLDDGQ